MHINVARQIYENIFILLHRYFVFQSASKFSKKTAEDSQSFLSPCQVNNIVPSNFININGPTSSEELLVSPITAPSQAVQTPRHIMVSGQQPQAMLPISSSVSNTNPPIDFTSLQPPPMETTLMSFASSQNQQIIQGKTPHLCITYQSEVFEETIMLTQII